LRGALRTEKVFLGERGVLTQGTENRKWWLHREGENKKGKRHFRKKNPASIGGGAMMAIVGGEKEKSG